MATPAHISSAAHPPTLNNIRNSYKPAASLTRSVPQGIGNVDVLALGSSHLKNLLYTAYHEKGFLINAVFLTLVHDHGNQIQDADLDQLWEIISSVSISKEAHNKIVQHLKKLSQAVKSLSMWKSSPYSKAVQFEDEASLSTLAAHLGLVIPAMEASEAQERSIQTPYLGEAKENDEINRYVSSAAPLSQQARRDVWTTSQQFFTAGTLSPSDGVLPNPLYIEGAKGLLLPENPLVGFHLSTAFTPLTELSPLRPQIAEAEPNKSFAAAKSCFIEWTHALAEALGNALTIRLVNADPHSYLDALQRFVQGDQTPCQYQTGHSSVPLRIAPNAVEEFDVIDASHITGNRLRILLTLAFSSPLLKRQPWATIFTEFNIRMGEMRENPLEDILYCDTPSMCLLLGLSSPEIITNASSTSIVDDVLLGIEDNVPLGNQTSPVYYCVSWKRSHVLAGSTSPVPLNITVDHLVDLLMELDDKMYELDQRYVEYIRNRTPSGLYRIGFLAPIIQAASRHANFSVADLCDNFFDHAPREARRPGISEELAELAIQLHSRGIYSAPFLRDPARVVSCDEVLSLPSVAAVNVVVEDYGRLQSFFEVGELDTKAILFEARVVHASKKFDLFRDLQVMTASALQTSLSTTPLNFKDNRLQVRTGAPKQLVFAFWAPTSILAGNDVEIELVGLPYPLVDTMYGIDICKGKISESVSESGPKFIITPTLPTSTEEPIAFSRAPAAKGPDPASQLQEGIDRQDVTSLQFSAKDKTGTVVAREILHSEKGRQLLTEKVPITIRQSGSHSIDIVFGKKKEETLYTVEYPTTVTSIGSKTRIARKSGYVEVIAKYATPDTPALLDTIFPSILSPDSIPVPLNLPAVNLDSLPSLDISDEAANKWITTLTSFQFSSRERAEREQANEKTGMTQSTRVNFKESLFSMFMTATGLQGGQTGLFALNQPGEDGVHMLIFVSAVRLDSASNSVILDAAVMPMTTEMLKNPEIEGFLLLLRTLEICSLDVDEAELKVWKKSLPAFAERCRTWEHLATCEYKAPNATVPLSLEKGGPVLCSCGKGEMPDTFLNLPGWHETASRYAVRVAISPAFACPLVERTVDFGPLMPREQEVVRCKACGRKEGDLDPGAKLKRCTRCLKVWYCSPQCQKKDWKKHRFECKEADEHGEN
ncbi:hypothetical protein jhhlp_005782 [Lomentospora prolificans]|uniref:MYND-type domain-containing protein n=1 Tax=Lomentospora prolificans TaxID=41688 RepID=A0A2N3N453_9PEZI|nr:hypothetical protein jhhlp_005782 [Lomentospora prolificans]